MTAIEKLRNMKHDKNGPLWVKSEGNYELPEEEQRCGCWRCKIENAPNLAPIRAEYANNLTEFMKLSASTKVPGDWRAKHTTSAKK